MNSLTFLFTHVCSFSNPFVAYKNDYSKLTSSIFVTMRHIHSHIGLQEKMSIFIISIDLIYNKIKRETLPAIVP